MKNYIKKGTWILICILLSLAIILLSGCRKSKRVPPASVKGALAYLESQYGRKDFEIKFLKENDVKPYKNNIGGIDGSYFYEDAPARTETCYLGYSPEDDLYFYVFHSTDSKAYHTYSTTLGGELETIGEFDEAIAYAKEVFGNRYKGADVHIYASGDSPVYDENEFKPIYGTTDIDARSAYNRLILETEDPFSSDIMHISRKQFRLSVSLYLNVYVDYPIKALNPKMNEVIDEFIEEFKSISIVEKFKSISLKILFIANDGIYNRPYLTLGMFNALKHLPLEEWSK